LRFLRRYPSPDLTNWRNSSSGLDSPSESHLRATACAGLPDQLPGPQTHRTPLSRFDPLRRFSSRAEPHTSNGFPIHWFMLRPQGFAPSRRLAPRTTYRACFIPNPSLGFTLRGFHPPAAPYAVFDVGPLLGFPLVPKNQLSPPGVQHAARSPPTETGV